MMATNIQAIRDWRTINSRPLYGTLTELNALKTENKNLREEIAKLKKEIGEVMAQGVATICEENNDGSNLS